MPHKVYIYAVWFLLYVYIKDNLQPKQTYAIEMCIMQNG